MARRRWVRVQRRGDDAMSPDKRGVRLLGLWTSGMDEVSELRDLPTSSSYWFVALNMDIGVDELCGEGK